MSSISLGEHKKAASAVVQTEDTAVGKSRRERWRTMIEEYIGATWEDVQNMYVLCRHWDVPV